MRGGVSVPCPAKVDIVRHDTEFLDSGAWMLSPTYTCARRPHGASHALAPSHHATAPRHATPAHTLLRFHGVRYADFLDRGIAASLTDLFAGASVVEVGAGKGCYAAELRRAPPARPGGSRIGVRAFDGAPNVANLTGGLVTRADLTSPMLSTEPAEWVLCLETAEHIPRAHEATLLRNLHHLNTVGIVMSWSNNAGGNGHVNLRSNEWVARRMRQMGYEHDLAGEITLRRAVRDIHWFRDTLMVFRRRRDVEGG